MDPVITVFAYAALGVALSAALSRTKAGQQVRLLFMPQPTYTVQKGQEFLPRRQLDHIGSDIMRFLHAGTGRQNVNTPIALTRFWWDTAEEDMKSDSAVLILDYVENITRYTQGPPKLEKFRLTLNLRWQQGDPRTIKLTNDDKPSSMPNISGPVFLCWTWSITNEHKKKSISADQIVQYTVDNIKAFLAPSLAPPAEPAKAIGGLLGTMIARSRRRASGAESRFTKVPDHLALSINKVWPSPQDFNEAVQIPTTSFFSRELKESTAQATELGLPKAITGAFASVYKMESSQHGTSAVKCFLREVSDQKERYQLIDEQLDLAKLPYTIGFVFMAEGIRIRDKRFPILKMEWLEGASLQDYIDEFLNDQAKIQRICEEFVEMIRTLQQHSIAHGDLQHGNIIITENGLRLVDYDGMFVPGMMGLRSNELGHRNYQHPDRTEMHFGPYIDNFSAWVIYISLRCLKSDPTLWSSNDSGDECLLFRQVDFAAPFQSELINELLSHHNEDIRQCAEVLRAMCAGNVERIPPVALALPSLQSLAFLAKNNV